MYAHRYRNSADIPDVLPVFPLAGVIVLPRGTLPLNVFEPRYLELVDSALSTDRLIGIVQPDTRRTAQGASPEGNDFPLKAIGCVGRLTSFAETDDGRYLVSLTGIARFRLGREREAATSFRQFAIDASDYEDDFVDGFGEDGVDRKMLLRALKTYLDAHGLSADWDSIDRSSNERLVNTLSMISPYGPEEKQALLEAPDLKTRASTLVALAEMELAATDDGSGTSLQ